MEPQRKAFNQAKELLTTSALLTHFDPKNPVILACDASPYGVGAAISHQMDDGKEQPISFAFRTLSTAERNYAQLDKEALAIIFGVKRFHQYLYGSSNPTISPCNTYWEILEFSTGHSR